MGKGGGGEGGEEGLDTGVCVCVWVTVAVSVFVPHFQVKSGMNMLVYGPNGCGKCSFHILGEVCTVHVLTAVLYFIHGCMPVMHVLHTPLLCNMSLINTDHCYIYMCHSLLCAAKNVKSPFLPLSACLSPSSVALVWRANGKAMKKQAVLLFLWWVGWWELGNWYNMELYHQSVAISSSWTNGLVVSSVGVMNPR